jgi:hypothetical protein
MLTNIIAIAWYRPQDYARLKAMFVDGDEMPDTFQEWESSVLEMVAMLTGSGQPVVKAYIDPETFPAWCAARGLPLDTHAKSRYGAEYARTSAAIGPV